MAKIEEIVLVVGQEANNNTSTSSTNYANKDLSNVADADILEKLKSVDGENSGLDADKLDGYHLLATINPDGSFNNDGIFKIKEVNGQKTLFGILDINMYVKSMPISFDIFGDGSRVALYEFEGNTNDTGGVYNAISFANINYEIGKIGQATKFNGNGYIELPSTLRTGLKAFTISLWFRNGILTSNKCIKSIYQECIYNTNTYPYSGIQIWQGYNDFNLVFRTRARKETTIVSLPTDSQFHHIVIVSDGNGNYKAYYDGEYKASITDTTDISNIQIIKLGSNFLNTRNQNFIGAIDNFSIFNRALTDEEIEILYNEGM